MNGQQKTNGIEKASNSRYVRGGILIIPGYRSPTILLVEDESSIVEVLTFTLQLENLTVLSCANGREAMKVLERFTPDLMVTDMMMPVMDGLELVRQVKQRFGENIPILAVSAMEPYLKEAKKLGVREAIRKPIDLDRFIHTVHSLLAQRPILEDVTASVLMDDEKRRLEAISALGLDRPAATEDLSFFALKVARLFHVPTCLVSIITAKMQFWTAGYGIPQEFFSERGGARKDAFCTIPVEAHAPLIVQNALENPIFKDALFVKDHGLRFYAGVPLTDFLGHVLGTLCLMAPEPKSFSALELDMLHLFSRRVLADIDWRSKKLFPDAPISTFRYVSYYDQELQIAGRQAFLDLLTGFARWFSTSKRLMSVFIVTAEQMTIEGILRKIQNQLPDAWLGRLGFQRLGVIVPELSEVQAHQHLVSLFGSSAIVSGVNVERTPERAVRDLSHLEDMFGELGLSPENAEKKKTA